MKRLLNIFALVPDHFGGLADCRARLRPCRADAPHTFCRASDFWAVTVNGVRGTCRSCAGICRSCGDAVKLFTGICQSSADTCEPCARTSGLFQRTRLASAGIGALLRHIREPFDHIREAFDLTSEVFDRTGETSDRTGKSSANHDFWPKTAKNGENRVFSLSPQTKHITKET